MRKIYKCIDCNRYFKAIPDACPFDGGTNFKKLQSCIFCATENAVINGICKKCIDEICTSDFLLEYLKYMTNRFYGIYKINYIFDMKKSYEEKYNTKFRIENEQAKKFLKDYCFYEIDLIVKYIKKRG